MTGKQTARVEQIEIGGTIESGDDFLVDITDVGTSTVENFNFQSTGTTLLAVRNGLIDAINDLTTGSAFVYATPGDSDGKIQLTALTPGNDFTVAVSTFEGDASAGDTQTITATNFIPNENTTTTPTYAATLGNSGSSYQPADTITIRGDDLGGNNIEHDLTITVSSVGASGEITAFTISGTAASGDAQYYTMNPTSVAFNASFLPRITGGAFPLEIVTGKQ